MRKRIRIVGKKRGQRRSVPAWTGPIGEVLFYAALVLSGGYACIYIFGDFIAPQWWASRNFESATCDVLGTRVTKRVTGGSTQYRPEIEIEYRTDSQQRSRRTWTYDIRFEHEFDQATARKIADSFQVGQQYICWYDPMNPANVVVNRHMSIWPWLVMIVPAAVLVYGGYRLSLTVAGVLFSAERLLRIESGRDLQKKRKGTAATHKSLFSAVPAYEDIINSPGTVLAYRLPGQSSFHVVAAAVTSLTVVFNVLVIALLISVFERGGSISSRLVGTAFALPLLGLGAWMTWLAVKKWIRHARRGVTRVEVDDHPLRPGEEHELALSQAGMMNVRRLEVFLMCQEHATYSPGTDVRFASETVFRQRLLRTEQIAIRPGEAYEAQLIFAIPASAMHSFVSDHNRIDWLIMVRVRSDRGSFVRRYPICVYPAAPLPQRTASTSQRVSV